MEEKIMSRSPSNGASGTSMAGRPFAAHPAAGQQNVSVIPASKRSVRNGAQLKQQTDINVAAYCRVSTGDESQQTSYTSQKAFYAGLIHSKPGWKFAGIYADEGISGTTTAHRDEFNRMIEDARAGKIDYIVTKSISRFARNTVTTLSCARELRQQNPPVGIYFEKENIDTLDATGELILTIMSALAQDESRSISDNIRWSFQKKFQAGIPQLNFKRLTGYDKGADGEWIINEAQARIVRRIYERYICGDSGAKIASDLNKDGIKTITGHKWNCGAIMTILRNEKYVGDLEMQKTITKDFLTHKASKNNGEAPKYYIENHHIPIIDRVTWDKVQAIVGRKLNRHRNEINETEDRRVCGSQERPMRRGAKTSLFSNLICAATIPSTGEECGSGLFRLTYSNEAFNYTDERSIAATGDDPEKYNEHYYFSHPVWRCKEKFGRRPEEEQPVTGNPETKKYCRTKQGSISNEEFANAKCPSSILNECAIKQSFMEMLYALKRDYEKQRDAGHPEKSELARLFQNAYEEAYRQTKASSVSAQRLETLNGQIREMEAKLNETIGKQVTAMRDAALAQDAELNEALAEGEMTLDDIEINIRNGLTGSSLGTKFYNMPATEGSDIEIYTGLVADLRQRIGELEQERNALEAEQGVLATYKKNFDFFLKCLLELPEKNRAGMKLNVNSLDVQGSVFRDVNGRAKGGRRSSHNSGHFKITPERVAEAPDFLDFEKGIYAAFITKGKVYDDIIEYHTNFGAKLLSFGNRRSLGSFFGFRKCMDDGTVDIIDENYKVDGGKIRYKRTPKKGVVIEEGEDNKGEENSGEE